jgi:hypothetical protein
MATEKFGKGASLAQSRPHRKGQTGGKAVGKMRHTHQPDAIPDPALNTAEQMPKPAMLIAQKALHDYANRL